METLRSCEVYDPATNRWTPCADLHMARAGSRVVTISSTCLAAVGGCDDVFGRAEMLPTVELFDTEAQRWTLLDLHLSTPRTTAAVAALEAHPDDRRILVIGGAPSLSTSEVYRVPDPIAEQAAGNGSGGVAEEDPLPTIRDIAEGRMGCQAVAIKLPAPGSCYPLCNRTCVVVVGGENGEEDWEGTQAHVRQFSSALVYDTEESQWWSDAAFPPTLTPRTAMALCVGHGRIRGYPQQPRSGQRAGGC